MAEGEGTRLDLGDVVSPDYLRPVYSNFAIVGHTPYDFRLTFALVKAPRPGSEVDDVLTAGKLSPEAVADMVIPLGMVPGLIHALQTNYTEYLKNYGIPGLEQGPQQEGGEQ
jgi:hypothetical protein